MDPRMTPAEYGRHLASQSPPLTDEQVELAARILAGVCDPDPWSAEWKRELECLYTGKRAES
jgi:hypothetical protein